MPICEVLAIQPASQSNQIPQFSQIDSGLSPNAITVGGSPFTYQNTSGNPGCVIVSGGTMNPPMKVASTTLRMPSCSHT